MKILFVCPWPPSKIRPRSPELLRMLTETNEVFVLFLNIDREDTTDVSLLIKDRLTVIDGSKAGAIIRTIAALPTGRSLQLSYCSDPDYIREYSRLVSAIEPDVVHFNVARSLAPLLRSSAPRTIRESRTSSLILTTYVAPTISGSLRPSLPPPSPSA
jgi:hypothetical protein